LFLSFITISALTRRQIVDLLVRKVITPELFDEKRILEAIDPEDPGRRYELCRNPLTAQRETTTRQNLLDVTRQGLDKIAAELLLDGCYVITTDAKPERTSSEKTVESYKRLRLMEMAFRNLKTVQLEVRPVFHKTDDRIRARVFLCVLAYYLQWHMNQRLQPLFASDGLGKNREWTFENVMARLAAIRREKVHLAGAEFHQVTVPEPDQQRILDLLGTRL
jgi:hypothetical protein